MRQILAQTIIFLYATVGIISTVAYWPTIKDVYIHKKPSANIKSYALWSVSLGISFAYASLIVSDLLLMIVTGLGFLCCLIILILSIKMKK